MKIGIAVTAFCRRQLFVECIKSLFRVTLHDYEIVLLIHNDGGSDFSAEKVVSDLLIDPNTREHKRFFPFDKLIIEDSVENKGIGKSLIYCYDRLFYEENCLYVINLDADTVVSENFIHKLVFTTMITGRISSGFNTLTLEPTTKEPRHPIWRHMGSYVLKKSVGGINLIMNRKHYEDIAKLCLECGYGWDTLLSRRIQDRWEEFGVTVPSVVDHMGFRSTLGHDHCPDIAFDFN